MPWRIYRTKQKHTKKDGTISIYPVNNRKLIKSNKPYKAQKKGLDKPSLWSSRFGLLDLYNRREQQELKCPSGYSISQCFNVMRKMWYGYHKARNEDDVEKMEKYAKAIQEVQKDMGIKTTSFPHLRLYGDQFVLNNKKGERIVFEDHSALKKQQDEYDKWAANNAKEIQAHLLKPDIEKGESIKTFPDESFSEMDIEEDEDYLVPNGLVPDEEAGEKLITMTDDIPFRNRKSD